jgi:hypothetical protein
MYVVLDKEKPGGQAYDRSADELQFRSSCIS